MVYARQQGGVTLPAATPVRRQTIKNRILDIPSRISDAPGAVELVRIWTNTKTHWITLNLPGKWRDAQLAELICNTMQVTARVMAPRTGIDEKTFATAIYQTLFDQALTSEQIENFYEKAVKIDAGHAQKPEIRQAVKKNMAVIPLADHENSDAFEVMRIWHLGKSQEVSFRAGFFDDIGNCASVIKSLIVYMANALYQRELKPSRVAAEEDLRTAIAHKWQQPR
ncbi:MAG: DUF5076 domain-containing protein [Aquisalinus sp.]|nr:DUF5076 domain-containing protein [Aquisalinus sp.]